MLTILVTGALGFIGSALTRRLLEAGMCVIGLDADTESAQQARRLADIQAMQNANWQFVEADICDNESLAMAVRRQPSIAHADIVVHLAAATSVRKSIADEGHFFRTNVDGFLNICRLCRQLNIHKLVYASSSSVYGNPGSPLIGMHTYDKCDDPLSFYAATKKCDEIIASAVVNITGNMSVIGLRLFNVYGPDCRQDLICRKFADLWRQGKSVAIYDYDQNMRDFTYIDDAVNALHLSILKLRDMPAGHSIYNVGNGKPIYIVDFASKLHEALRKVGALPADHDDRSNTMWLPRQIGDTAYTRADITETTKDLNWLPSTSINVGLQLFAEWYAKVVCGL